MARLGPVFDPQNPPKKFMWVPFLRPFPGNEAHTTFSWGPKSGVSGGGQKVYVEKVYVLSPSLKQAGGSQVEGNVRCLGMMCAWQQRSQSDARLCACSYRIPQLLERLKRHTRAQEATGRRRG